MPMPRHTDGYHGPTRDSSARSSARAVLNIHMRLHEIDNVIPFPQRRATAQSTKIDVPPGYDSFYLRKAGPTSSHIMGITPDGRHVQISTTTDELAHILVQAYNRGGVTQSPVKKVSMTQAFGSDVEQEFEGIGVRFSEKPSSWANIRNQASCTRDQRFSPILSHVAPRQGLTGRASHAIMLAC